MRLLPALLLASLSITLLADLASSAAETTTPVPIKKKRRLIRRKKPQKSARRTDGVDDYLLGMGLTGAASPAKRQAIMDRVMDCLLYTSPSPRDRG